MTMHDTFGIHLALLHQRILGKNQTALDAGRFIGAHGVKAAHRFSPFQFRPLMRY
jgi:hypothetical protein